jgi:hypothetical protein
MNNYYFILEIISLKTLRKKELWIRAHYLKTPDQGLTGN